ncbi:UDP-N-acetylglucosamine 2-epimerase (non-hydrolyzing) [soil metagenome]
MSRTKVLTVVGTRPELIKLSRVIAELDRSVEHVLVHTGQNYDYELNEVFFSDLEIRQPDHFLNAAAETPAATVAKVIAASDEVIAREAPDALLLLGDTNSCLAAYAAKRRQVPVFHMEAGNRCFDERVPEEINRRVVDHLSDVNLTYTEHARRYLLREGFRPELVIKTGSPMKEVLTYYGATIAESRVLERLGLAAGEYFLVSAHREENITSDTRFSALLDTLNRVAGNYGKRVIVSTHPRTRKRLEQVGEHGVSGLVEFTQPFGFHDYIKLQQHARCVLSDSGTITEESALLGFPAVTLRQAHERPEGMDSGVLVMTGLEAARVIEAIDVLLRQHADRNGARRVVADYEVDDVSTTVVRIILSYIHYVRRTVWYAE